MKVINIAAVITSILLMWACNQNPSDQKANSEDAPVSTGNYATNMGKVFPLSIQKGGSYRSVDQIRIQALGIINHRIKEQPKALAMLTHTSWQPEFVYNDRAMSGVDEYAEYWIKFGDDFRYKYGVGQKITGGGKYHFRLEDKSLYMLNDNVEHEPKVWRVNYNGSVLAMAGTNEYKVNNGMQIKMIEIENKPEI